jgi:hypothetical protein
LTAEPARKVVLVRRFVMRGLADSKSKKMLVCDETGAPDREVTVTESVNTHCEVRSSTGRMYGSEIKFSSLKEMRESRYASALSMTPF